VRLYNASGQSLGSDSNGGPGNASLLSDYELPETGTYYARVSKHYWSQTQEIGNYQLRVDLARGIDLESDRNYSNDTIATANPVSLTVSGAGEVSGAIAGTVMSAEGTNRDEDVYSLGRLSAGNVVDLEITLPSGSTLAGQLRIRNSAGDVVAEKIADGSPLQWTVTGLDDYYAEVTSGTVRDGRFYEMLPSQSWDNAEATAQLSGGHLVTINDAAEQAWIAETFGASGNFLIGLSDTETEGTFVWADGTPLSYTNWATGEPNNGNSWDYAYLETSTGLWQDYHSGALQSLSERPDPLGRTSGGPGPLAQYVLGVTVSDVVAPTVTDVTRFPGDGQSGDELASEFQVIFSEDMDPLSVN
ncbi:C-type lectin domain-containing protein, partial [Novipirellula aureliae]|uniref:C-type lectin domain-containing protein n=1 Tax=Novipirellula aureliae TaxID=2527966 RepID=UPI0018CF868D